MPVYHHLTHFFRIVRLPGKQWLAELDKLTPEERAEVEPFLREYAQRMRCAKSMKNKRAGVNYASIRRT